ncbi:MAG: GNAT family N-acetyltransferase [Clostridiales bacterium]|nr:GNAT family N-acetyltransferase [Clostridiales bacterium]
MKRTILAERNVKEAAFKLLYADELQNALLLKCIVQNRAADIRVLGQSVSLRDKSSGHYFFRSEEIGEFEALYGTAEPKVFFISTDVLYEDLRRLHPQLDIHKYAQMVYKGDGNFDLKEYDGIAFRKMTPEDLPFVVATQDGDEFDEAYFAHRIESGVTVCAVEKETGQIVGYFMQHNDGENGPTYIAEKCRNLGMGTELLKRIIKEALEIDPWVVGLVRPENTPGQVIGLKTGHVRCPKEVLWCYDI